MLLEPEQEQFLIDLVEADRKVPRDQRQHFAIARTISGTYLIHAGWDRSRTIFEGDVDVLASAGLVAKALIGARVDGFFVTPAGSHHYARLKQQQGLPLERMAVTVKTYLDAQGFRQRYAAAYGKWALAEQQLWSSDSSQAFTTIGHLCREAMQEFAAELIARCGVTDADPDKAKTVSRLRAALVNRAKSLGEKERAFLDALVAYWGTVSDLVQRQEHGAQREPGKPLTWPDARHVVFQAAVVMFEIDASLTSASDR